MSSNPQSALAYVPADDRAMITAIVQGDGRAFEGLMRRHNQRLYRLARAVLRDESDAEDALQDAYLQAYRSISQFRGDASLSTWLSKLVLNECFGRKRRDARRHNVLPMVSGNAHKDSIDMLPDDTELPDRALARTQMRAMLEHQVDELPANYRVVFVMRSVEEMSVDETAAALGIPLETVRTRHFRAKSLLREALAREADLAERDLYEFGGSRCDRIAAAVLRSIGSAAQD